MKNLKFLVIVWGWCAHNLNGDDSGVSPEFAFQAFVQPVTNICGLVWDKKLKEISGKKLIAIIYYYPAAIDKYHSIHYAIPFTRLKVSK